MDSTHAAAANVVAFPAVELRPAETDGETRRRGRGPAPEETQAPAVAPLEGGAGSLSGGRRLNFEVDETTGRIIIRVTNSQTGEVLRTIPSDEALRTAAKIGEASGLLLDVER